MRALTLKSNAKLHAKLDNRFTGSEWCSISFKGQRSSFCAFQIEMLIPKCPLGAIKSNGTHNLISQRFHSRSRFKPGKHLETDWRESWSRIDLYEPIHHVGSKSDWVTRRQQKWSRFGVESVFGSFSKSTGRNQPLSHDFFPAWYLEDDTEGDSLFASVLPSQPSYATIKALIVR